MRKITGIAVVMVAAMVSLAAQNVDRRSHVVVRDHGLTAEVATAPVEPAAYSYPAEDFKPGVVRVGPPTTYLKEGLRVEEVIRLLGKPLSISERSENGTTIVSYEFRRGEGRVLVAEFELGILVRSRTETRGEETAAVR